MSGDRGASVSVPAALAAAREFSDVRFTLTGRQADLQRELAGRLAGQCRVSVRADVVEMSDHPREALASQERFIDAPGHRSGQGP